MEATRYRPEIDGLRAIAVLAVMLFHLNRRWLPGGFFGVDVFFVISGYLITSVILRDCQGGRFTFRRFYQRRIARLLPAFLAAALATVGGAALIYSPQDLATTGATFSAAVASVANLKFLLQGNYFALSPDSQPFLHCWSLSVEEQFYLLFPAAFLVLYRQTSRYRLQVLAAFLGASLLCYVALTRGRPEWAFYLLPARAWELLAGSILTMVAVTPVKRARATWCTGGILLAISFAGGQNTIVPVLATACLLWAGSAPFLCCGPLVLLGRMSYSLYLWHWPIFSLVDYQLYWQPMLVRLILKVALSFGAAALCYLLVEQPGRTFLNHPSRQRLAFACLALSLAILIPLGIGIRNANYLNADARAIHNGGLHLNPRGRNGSMILMGDSNGSMYGKVAAEIASERDWRLDVISVEAGDPLPRSDGRHPALWLDSLAVVKARKPDLLVLVCKWDKLEDDPGRLALALRELRPYARLVTLVTQPPVLPEIASREAIRNGSRPPFWEDAGERAARAALNELVKSVRSENVSVVDIEPLFARGGGEIRFVDSQRRQLYQDRDHLSVAGAMLVKPALLAAIGGLKASR